ncbi:MAG TPA: histidine kinase [Blastocatellia bacterium]|nr:histidine kinase [Blastocatellia bacterium]
MRLDIGLEMIEAHLASEALGFGAGVALSVLLLGLLRRGAGKQPDARAGYYQATAALMWNLGGLLIASLTLFGAKNHRLPLLTALVLHISGAAFFPPAFLALRLKPSDPQSIRAKSWRLLRRISFVSAVILTTHFIATMSLPNIPPNINVFDKSQTSNLVAWHVAIVIGVGALLLLPGRLNDFVSGFYAGATVIGASAPAVMTLIVDPTSLSPPLWLAYCIVMHQLPLLILLGAIVFFADFRFSNVYVKSSLQLLIGLLLALGYCLLIIGPLPRMADRITAYPVGSLVSFSTALLVLFLWIFVRLNPIMSRLVDRWLFREPDYAAATRRVWEEIGRQDGVEHNSIEEQERIFQTVARFVRETLELEDVRVIPISAVEVDHLAATLNSGEVCELSYDDPARWKLDDCGEMLVTGVTIGGRSATVKRRLCGGTEFLAPVRVKGKPTHLLAITPGARRRHLLDSEIGFIRAVAGQVSSRLEALQFEQEKADRQNREERLRRQITEAELRALRAQINPHFLFNSLNTIADLIVTDQARAERMTVHLAKVFRHVLNNSDRQMITVGEELEFLRAYLEIEAMRFDDRLSVRFDIDTAAANEPVPSLILQPLVENALKHGLARKVGRGSLQISVEREDGFLRLAVEDDGPGFSPSPYPSVAPAIALAGALAGAQAGVEANQGAREPSRMSKTNGNGVGLRNVTERLTTIYSGQAQVLFEQGAGGGSRVTLLLPRYDSNADW